MVQTLASATKLIIWKAHSLFGVHFLILKAFFIQDNVNFCIIQDYCFLNVQYCTAEPQTIICRVRINKRQTFGLVAPSGMVAFHVRHRFES